ncbi:MAG: hypothetical protein J5847_03545 [Clostridia bacterium]|nr:hypothetical protein [Clostridia bacterium]
MAQKRTKKNDKLGKGGIAALIIAGLLLIALLVGVIFFVHSGKAGVSESAGLITANETTAVEQTTALEPDADETTAKAVKTVTDKDGNVVTVKEDEDAAGAKSSGTDETTKKEPAKDTAKVSPSDIVFQSKVTAKQLGQYYDADVDTFRKVYDGKTVTVTGKVASKSPKMLYVELATGTKVPMRIYLSTEAQREAFNLLEKGKKITVKGNLAILYPEQVDAGGFQEMANGLIALDSVTLVK